MIIISGAIMIKTSNKQTASKVFYKVNDSFYKQTYNGKTYGEISNKIIADLVNLKTKFPELTAIDSEARYNLVKGTENFSVTFQYNNPKTQKIEWSVEMREYQTPDTPEGKTPITQDMLPDYAFLGKIKNMLVIFDMKTNNAKLKTEIVSILKKDGAVAQDKRILW